MPETWNPSAEPWEALKEAEQRAAGVGHSISASADGHAMLLFEALREMGWRLAPASVPVPEESGWRGRAQELENAAIEFDAWLSFRGEFAEVLTAFREAFGTDTSAEAAPVPVEEPEKCEYRVMARRSGIEVWTETVDDFGAAKELARETMNKGPGDQFGHDHYESMAGEVDDLPSEGGVIDRGNGHTLEVRPVSAPAPEIKVGQE